MPNSIIACCAVALVASIATVAAADKMPTESLRMYPDND